MILNNAGFPILINSLAPSCWEKCCSSCSMKQVIWAGRKWFGWSFSWIEGLTGVWEGVEESLHYLQTMCQYRCKVKRAIKKLCKNPISYGLNNRWQHWDMLTHSSGRFVSYTPVQQVPQRSARYRPWSRLFSSIHYVKDTGEHGGVTGVHFEGWTPTSHIFHCKVELKWGGNHDSSSLNGQLVCISDVTPVWLSIPYLVLAERSITHRCHFTPRWSWVSRCPEMLDLHNEYVADVAVLLFWSPMTYF